MGFEPVLTISVVSNEDVLDDPLPPIGFKPGRIVKRTFLSEPGLIPAFHHYLVLLPQGITYDPSDHFLVLPENTPGDVDRVIKALGYDPWTVLAVPERPGDTRNLIPPHVSITQLFTQFIDLNCAPTHTLITVLYEAANEEGRAKIEPLIDETDPNSWAKYMEDISVADAVVEFAQYGIPDLNTMISSLPRMNPRIYSVASAPTTNPGYVELMVLDVHFGKNMKRHGIGTYFLASPNTSQIMLKPMKGIWHYPEDQATTPIIMISVGGGMSTMFSLIQHRMAAIERKESLAPAMLFFAAKSRGSYPLLLKKLDKFRDLGILQYLFVGFQTGEQRKKTIVDLIHENSAKFWLLWKCQKTHIYYSGPFPGLFEQIKEAINEITLTEGWLSLEEATTFSRAHRWYTEQDGSGSQG
jgi:sulfite reductase alpha subunit-like flavoprotein